MSFYKADVAGTQSADADLLTQANRIYEHAIKEATMEAVGAAIVTLSNMVSECEGNDRSKISEMLDGLEQFLMKGTI